MVTLSLTLLTTLTTTRSPSLVTILGPGNLPFTVGMARVVHSRVTFCIITLKV
uniref:Uncharacterized protein n=1 Tax=Arundo donax TaxID=35708 RepID=A0A0A9V3A9_ARUDO